MGPWERIALMGRIITAPGHSTSSEYVITCSDLRPTVRCSKNSLSCKAMRLILVVGRIETSITCGQLDCCRRLRISSVLFPKARATSLSTAANGATVSWCHNASQWPFRSAMDSMRDPLRAMPAPLTSCCDYGRATPCSSSSGGRASGGSIITSVSTITCGHGSRVSLVMSD